MKRWMQSKAVYRMVCGEAFIVTVFSVVALLIAALPWFIKLSSVPVGRDMIPVHNSLGDYPFYVSVIRQGIDGSMVVFDRFAVEPHNGSLIHFLYLAIGWAARIVGIQSANLAYHLSRFVLGALWCIVVYWFCDTIIRNKWVRILAFFFTLFSTSFPKFVFVNGQWTVTWFMSWWSELDPTIRIAFLPHFTLGHIAMVVAFISLFRYASKPSPKWLVLGGVAGFIAAFVHPPSAILLFMTLPLYVLLIRKKRWVASAGVILFFAGIGLLILNHLSSVFPWSLAKEFEGWSYAILIPEYFLALGPVILFAAIGAVNRIRVPVTWFLLLWIITSIVAIPLSKQIPFSPIAMMRAHPISNIRFLQMAIWLPLGVLGAYGFFDIWKHLGKAAGVIILTVFLFLTFVGYPATINEQIHHIYFTYDYSYPKKGYLEAIGKLAQITSKDQTVLSLSLGGMTIPMYVDRTSYVGQVVYTPDLNAKMAASWQFYKGMSSCEAYKFLKKNRVGAVLYSFDERNAGDAVHFYPFLQSWNRYGDTEIFTVVQSPPAGCN